MPILMISGTINYAQGALNVNFTQFCEVVCTEVKHGKEII